MIRTALIILFVGLVVLHVCPEAYAQEDYAAPAPAAPDNAPEVWEAATTSAGTEAAYASPPPSGFSIIGVILLLFMLSILVLPQALICFYLAGLKGYDRALWTVCGLVPFFGFYGMIYLAGARDKHTERRIDALYELIEQKG